MGTVQEIEIGPCKQVLWAQSRTYLGEWDAQSSLGFWDTKRQVETIQTTAL